MEAWFASVCQLLGPEVGAAWGVICTGLAALLSAVIVLGFGPLHAWLGLSKAQRPPHGHSASSDEGLRGIWQLYRELGGVAQRHR